MKEDVGSRPGWSTSPGCRLREIAATPDGGLRIGALVTNSRPRLRRRGRARYPLLSPGDPRGRSPQLRNMATTGGNLLQRTRCYYFYDAGDALQQARARQRLRRSTASTASTRCWARATHCIATHPSDMCVALAALEAIVHVKGPRRRAHDPIRDFHRLPGDTPAARHQSRARRARSPRSSCRARLRRALRLPQAARPASYAFALVSVAAALGLEATRSARRGSRSAAWRTSRGATASRSDARRRKRRRRDSFGEAADVLLEGAQGYGHNDFKIGLARRAIVRALAQAAPAGKARPTRMRLTEPPSDSLRRHAGRAASTAARRSPAPRNTRPSIDAPDSRTAWSSRAASRRGRIAEDRHQRGAGASAA